MKKTLILAMALVAGQAMAKTKASPYFQTLKAGAPFTKEATQYKWTTSAEVKANKARFGSQKRNPSSSGAGDESMMSDKFKETRDQFLKLKTADELEAFLTEHEEKFETYRDEDQRFFISQLLPLRELRGIVWRSRPVFSKTKIAHSFVLTSVKSAVSSVKILLPTEQWHAGLEYVSNPYVRDGKVATEFKSEAELIAHIAGPFRDALLVTAKRIQSIDLKDKTIVWDNKLAFGKASFQDDIDRYRLVGEVERLSSLGSLHALLAQVTYQRAYSGENSMKLYQDMGKLYGVDGFFSQVDGAPSSKRVEILRKPAYANYATLVEDGRDWMKLSFNHLKESVNLTASIWNQIKAEDRPLTEAFIFDTSFARAYERGSDLAIANMEAMVNGKAQIRSGVTGEVVVVDLPAFYENPPQDLKSFLPTQFDRSAEWKVVVLKDSAGKQHKVKTRNYEVGRGIDWNAEAYRQIFPSLASGQDIPKNVRILSQTWGTWMAAMPLADIIE
ncbi:MAG: hypothetical protein ACLGG0_07740 [Bacteriovoracia bacterium]